MNDEPVSDHPEAALSEPATLPATSPDAPLQAPEGPSATAPRNWAAACHLAALCGYASMPMGFVLGPLIVWAIARDKHPLVDDQGKEAINFQLSILLYTLACIPLICLCVGIVLLILLSLMNFIFIIVATVRASSGERYRYPLTIRFLK